MVIRLPAGGDAHPAVFGQGLDHVGPAGRPGVVGVTEEVGGIG